MNFRGFLKKFSIINIAMLMLIIVILIINIVTFKSEELEKADAIIILGHSLVDEILPSDWLVARLQDGLWLYENGYSDIIVVTGGKGPTDSIPVSVAMEHWLVGNGVPKQHIIIEDNASNTFENLKYVKNITKDKNINKIIIVTNDFHLFRSKFIGQYFYENPIMYGNKIGFSVKKLFAYIKESFSLIKYYIKIKLL